MTGVAIRVDARQLVGTGGDLAERLEKAGRLGGVLDEIGSLVTATTIERFERGEAPDGTPWQPSQRAIAEGGLTLVNRGHLKSSTHYVVGGSSVAIGSNLVYAAIQHGGGQAGRNLSVTLPARPIYGISSADRRGIQDILSDHLREAMQ
ncbi:MAG TPA: phage virion morphogenesis protein [Rhodospirillaceae bacterium]|nr:phage virion morphogenesis protein [Magnetovibrio sp.]HBT44308.1 phage virion morphogenesis protein [Rhodospirillaceae bacterium]HCS70087.1 phage virion morphogenesis protein [Rhodospirillaceae bacterium]|tara:strand:- start:833 stop:1279 length:447 start_codon:yes stop_codon:yes gene_type:complete